MSDGSEEKKLKSILVKPGEKKEKKSGAVVLQEEAVQGHDADDPHHKKFIEKSAVIEGHEGLLVRRYVALYLIGFRVWIWFRSFCTGFGISFG
jgi:hypothetical protein